MLQARRADGADGMALWNPSRQHIVVELDAMEDEAQGTVTVKSWGMDRTLGRGEAPTAPSQKLAREHFAGEHPVRLGRKVGDLSGQTTERRRLQQEGRPLSAGLHGRSSR